MVKTIKLPIGGEERVLKFGTMLFFKHAGEAYQGDPMELVYGFSTLELITYAGKPKHEQTDVTKLITGITDPVKLYHIILAFVYGGLKCAGNDVTVEQVNEWVNDMDFETGSMILTTGREALQKKHVNGEAPKTEAAGEAAAQTEQTGQPNQ